MGILVRSIIRKILVLIAVLFGIVSCLPVVILLAGAFTDRPELLVSLDGILNGQGETYLVLLPSFPTLRGFVEALLDRPEFYVVFWNSVKIAGLIAGGQTLFAVPAAWGFSRWHGKVSSLLFYLYTVLMLLPFQVTMLSDYLVMDFAGLLDTHAALILPAVFSTFPVFIIYRSFLGIPEEIYEAFSLDSSSRLRMFCHLGVPLAMPGIKAAALLGLAEYWNIVEQPLLFLKTPSLWPFSLYIPEISEDNVQHIFAASVIALVPMLLLFLGGKEDMEKGVGTMALKQ